MISKLILLVFIPLFIYSQESKISVKLDFSGDDPVGKQLQLSLKTQLKESTKYSYFYGNGGAKYIMMIVTLDPLDQFPDLVYRGKMCMYSYTIVRYEPCSQNLTYCGHGIGASGIGVIAQQASDILDKMDDYIQYDLNRKKP